MDNKRIVTYTEYGELLDKLCQLIVQQKKVLKYTKYICGIPRGGYPVAVHLAHHLNKKFIEYYHLDRKQEEETILVDDIADTGATFKLHATWDTLATATLFYKQRSSYEPMFYVETTDKWIVFPWERTDEIPNRPV